ncbi:MAG: hypothetical protein QOD40_1541 [Alphaproteobacteria bacterium]|nr:hypothetical protein [Alphaproteobacteria bacterium]
MRFVRSILVCAAFANVSSMTAARAETDKERKEDLVTLYLMSVAAERCGFPMTAKQAAMVDRAEKLLAERLRLREDQTDEVYSDADVAFEKEGPKVCDRNGGFAKLYNETLQKLVGP